MEEELCCKYENGRSEYFRCDGSDFRRSCDPEEENELRLDESNFKNNKIHLGRYAKCQSNSRPFEERGRGCPHHSAARQEGVPDFHGGERRRGWPRQEQGATEAAAGRLQGRWQDDHATGAAAKVEEAAGHQGEGREADQVRDTFEGYIVLGQVFFFYESKQVPFEKCVFSIMPILCGNWHKKIKQQEKNLALLEYGAIMESNKEKTIALKLSQ